MINPHQLVNGAQRRIFYTSESPYSLHSQTRTRALPSISNNLQLLSNGALKLPAEITIGNRLYNITTGFSNSPNYLGHPTNEPDTAVVIRTNHLYGLFDRPGEFLSQLKRTQRSGLLLDFDARHSILVLLDIKSLRSNAKRLAQGVLTLPNYAMIGKRIYVIDREMDRKEGFSQYFGYLKRNFSDQVSCKSYHDDGMGMFKREAFALKMLDRLSDKDEKNMIVVSPYIQGRTLDYFLKNIYKHPSYIFKFLEDFIPSIQQLHAKSAISHGNINATNVLIKLDGTIVLVNFEYSFPLKTNIYSPEHSTLNVSISQLRIEHDIDCAKKALETQNGLIQVLKTPLEISSQRFLWKYISDIGLMNKKEYIGSLWYAIRKKQLSDFETSKINNKSTEKYVVNDSSVNIPIKMAALYLVRPLNIRLPLIITVGINQYKLTHYISTGAEGSTYRGFMVEDPFERIVLKIYKQPYPEKHFLAERFALLVTGRLRDDDYKNFITVQKEIPGPTLLNWYKDELEKSKSTGVPPISKEDLFKQITQLLLGFHTQWGLAHNDVRPQNIIRKYDGSLELIDFGFSKVLATDDDESYEKQIEKDFVKAQREYELFFAGLAVENAFRMPSRDKIPIVKKFVNILWERGDRKQAYDVWEKYIARI